MKLRETRHGVLWAAPVLFLVTGLAVADEDSADLWSLRLYADIGFVPSDNDPANHEWRSKVTTAWLDEPELFLGMANVTKRPTRESPWGFEFGLQTGKDSEGVVPAPPPPESVPLTDADEWRHLYRANVSYLLDAGRGVRLNGGLIDSFVGYESYLGIENANYTRGYLVDNVPYFLIGFEAIWDVSEQVDLGFCLMTGWDYLAKPNGTPSTGFQLGWQISSSTRFTQNVYYGPDQRDKDVEYWRFFSDSILTWQRGRLGLAGIVDYGQERQSAVVGHPRYRWGATAIVVRYDLARRWSVALRPEVFWDPDGLITGARQTLQGYTGTVKYELAPRQHRLVGTLEARFDRSTGDQGGFFAGPDNRLVEDQWTVTAAVLWSFDGWP